MKENYDAFLELIRLGIGCSEIEIPGQINWAIIQQLAFEHGLSAVVLDGLETLPEKQRPSQVLLLNWIGEVLQNENFIDLQKAVADDMSKLFYKNGIRTYILKGIVISECYPKPNHRISVDVDCFLLLEKSDFDAWSLGNDLIRAKGFQVNTDFYKNSSFDLSGVLVENHQYMVPFRGNKKLRNLEILLRNYMREDHGDDKIEGTCLYRPPVMVSALFLVEHAYSHFLHEGLTWKHVLDWMMFSKKHENDFSWSDFNAFIDEFGFRKFYDSYLRLGKYLLGEIEEDDLNRIDKKMLADIWAPLDLHETVIGLKGKLALAGNTWRARWKYHNFGDISMLHALYIQIKGFLLEKKSDIK